MAARPAQQHRDAVRPGASDEHQDDGEHEPEYQRVGADRSAPLVSAEEAAQVFRAGEREAEGDAM